VIALDLDGFELLLFDLDILAFFQLIAAALMVSRLPVSLLIMWKRVFSTDVEAGYNTTGQDTKESFSVPFQ
jgi:hypothetical protein